jgi:type II secretory pathway component PulF
MRADGMPALEVALVAAGEQSGKLVEICKTLSGYYRQFAATRRAAIGRLIYPVFLLHFALVVATVPWIAPKIVEGNTAALGWLLIGPASLWVLLLLAWLLLRWLGPEVRSALIERVPGLAGCTEAWVVTNVCMVLRATNSAGMLVPQSMELAAEAAGHRLMSVRLSTIAKTMFGGPLTMSQALAKAGFPKDVIARLQVAEQSGSTDDVLDLLILDWRDRFDRRLAMLAGFCTSAVYALAMLAAVVVIFKFYSSYFGNLASIAQEAGG